MTPTKLLIGQILVVFAIVVAGAGEQIVQRNLDIQPTITIRPGAAVRLVVHKDLILAPWVRRGH